MAFDPHTLNDNQPAGTGETKRFDPDTCTTADLVNPPWIEQDDFEMLPPGKIFDWPRVPGDIYDRPRLADVDLNTCWLPDAIRIDARDRDIVEVCEDHVTVQRMFWNAVYNDQTGEDLFNLCEQAVPRATLIREIEADVTTDADPAEAEEEVAALPVEREPATSVHKGANGVPVPGLLQYDMMFDDTETVAPMTMMGLVGKVTVKVRATVTEIPDILDSATVAPVPQPDDKGDELYQETKRIGLVLSLGGPWGGQLAERVAVDGTQIRRWGKGKGSTPVSLVESARKLMDGHIEACLRVRGLTSFQLTDTPGVGDGN